MFKNRKEHNDSHVSSQANNQRKALIRMKTLDFKNRFELFRVKQGACFGEMAIIEKVPRNASASAVGDVDLFYLDEEAFRISFSNRLSKSLEERKNFIQNIIPAVNLKNFNKNYLKIVPYVNHIFT